LQRDKGKYQAVQADGHQSQTTYRQAAGGEGFEAILVSTYSRNLLAKRSFAHGLQQAALLLAARVGLTNP
jgi:hypothetical protein